MINYVSKFKEKYDAKNIKDLLWAGLAIFSIVYLAIFAFRTTPASASAVNLWDQTNSLSQPANPVNDTFGSSGQDMLAPWENASDASTVEGNDPDPGVLGGPLASMREWIDSVQVTVANWVVKNLANILTPDITLIGRISNNDYSLEDRSSVYGDITGDGMAITKTFWVVGVVLGVTLATLLTFYNAIMLVAGRAQAIKENPLTVLAKYVVYFFFIAGSSTLINFVITEFANLWSTTINGVIDQGGLQAATANGSLLINVKSILGIAAFPSGWLIGLLVVILQVVLFFKILGGFFNMFKNYFEKYLLFMILLCLSPFFVATLVSNTMKQSFSNYVRMIIGQFISMLINFLMLMLFFSMWFQGAFSSFIGCIVAFSFLKLSKNIDRYISMTGLNVAQTAANAGRGFLANAANLVRTAEGLSRASGRIGTGVANKLMAAGDYKAAQTISSFTGNGKGVLDGMAENAGLSTEQRLSRANSILNNNLNDKNSSLQTVHDGETFALRKDGALDYEGAQKMGIGRHQLDTIAKASPDAHSVTISRERGNTNLGVTNRNGSVIGVLDNYGNYRSNITGQDLDAFGVQHYESSIKDSMANQMAERAMQEDASLGFNEARQSADSVLENASVAQIGENGQWGAITYGSDGQAHVVGMWDEMSGSFSTVDYDSSAREFVPSSVLDERYDTLLEREYSASSVTTSSTYITSDETRYDVDRSISDAVNSGASRDTLTEMYRHMNTPQPAGQSPQQQYWKTFKGSDGHLKTAVTVPPNDKYKNN